MVTYNLDFRLAAVLNTQREGSLQSTLVLQQQEGLMRPLRLAAVLGRQADREGILSVEGYWGLERGFGAESVRKSQQLARSELEAGRQPGWAHFSLVASPPAFLLLTATLPSSKFHDDAAWTAPAARRTREDIPVNRILTGWMWWWEVAR